MKTRIKRCREDGVELQRMKRCREDGVDLQTV
jgi:hypothetical protein